MKTKIDVKSMLVGIALGVAVMLGVGAATSPGPIGRFQISATGNHGLVLDTATGQVWSYFFMSSGGPTPQDFFAPKLGQKL